MAASLTPGSKYDDYLRSLLKSAKCVNNVGPEQCLANKTYTFQLSDKMYVEAGAVSFICLTQGFLACFLWRIARGSASKQRKIRTRNYYNDIM